MIAPSFFQHLLVSIKIIFKYHISVTLPGSSSSEKTQLFLYVSVELSINSAIYHIYYIINLL